MGGTSFQKFLLKNKKQISKWLVQFQSVNRLTIPGLQYISTKHFHSVHVHVLQY